MSIRIALGVTVVLATVMGVSACSNPTGKSWAITYEVSSNSGSTLSEVGYMNSPGREQHAELQDPPRWNEGLSAVTASAAGMPVTCAHVTDK
ncbi:MAG: putative secreted protein [Amycolatopsis sp.]|uniref:hypothetical protein n=1 Tax=Amycolatopsis sp. TaxID=37632 RepID=UPI00260C36CB|nr:hypothetical protein [Amycolatopsis sp.]MCU1679341.1 putative secreted protein [Amycolatopsis sp.]